jgi:hypothetical protein
VSRQDLEFRVVVAGKKLPAATRAAGSDLCKAELNGKPVGTTGTVEQRVVGEREWKLCRLFAVYPDGGVGRADR